MAQQQATDCSNVPRTLPQRQGLLPAIADPLAPAGSVDLSRSGILGQALDSALTADYVLLRLRIETCTQMAMAAPAGSPVRPNDPSAYRPPGTTQQQDLSAWRFDMTQNGKAMTSAEFDAWMRARGIRVVPARPAPAPVTPPPAEQPVTPKP